MTTGALIFAFNNGDIDYLEMASWSAGNIRRHLGIGTTVVTDSDCAVNNANFEKVILVDKEQGGSRHFSDIGNTVPWYNGNRVDAYNLTPYDLTLVLDADYVVASNELKSLFSADRDFMCHRRAYNIATADYLTELNKFGTHGFPLWWATVMLFRKSNTAQYIFDCMTMIKQNWQHYRDLYNIHRSNYRNDFALSIALGIVNGHTQQIDSIPWPLATVMPEVKLAKIGVDEYTLEYLNHENQPKYQLHSGFDFHAMGKKHLGDIVAAS